MNSPVNRMQKSQHLINSFVVENYLTSDECKKALKLAAKTKKKPATLTDTSVDTKMRDSTVRWVGPDKKTDWLFKKLSSLAGLSNKKYQFNLQGLYEGIQFATYENSGHFDWHIDLGTDIMSLRKLSISVQLSDDDDYVGGDFQIINHDMPYARKLGTAIIFPSYMTHRVTPVTQGIRHALVAWVHGDSFR